MIKALIFDFDGTLVNTIEDLKDSINMALISNGFDKQYSTEETKNLIGKGIRVLCTRALNYCPHSIEDEENVYKSFYEYYSKNQINKTRPYVNVVETLLKLNKSKIKLAILSNKKHEVLLEIVDKLFPKNLFDIIFGKKEEFDLKPNPKSLIHILDVLSVNKDEVLYVGDSDVDMITAINANVKKVAVTYGYREKKLLESYNPEYIIDNISELLKII